MRYLLLPVCLWAVACEKGNDTYEDTAQVHDTAPSTTEDDCCEDCCCDEEAEELEYFQSICSKDPKTMDVWDSTQILSYYVSINAQQVEIANIVSSTVYYYGNEVDTHINAYADFLVVWQNDECAFIQQPEVKILGEMNFLELPNKSNLGFDTDEYVPGQELGDDEHPSLHNLLYGGPLREAWLYNEYIPSLGMHSKRVAWVWLSANFWGGQPEDGGLKLDYQLHERWKNDGLDRSFGKKGWMAAWEGGGDFLTDAYPLCQEGECQDHEGYLDSFSAALENPESSGGMISVLDAHVSGGHKAFFDFWASEVLINQWDGYSAAQHNFVVVLTADGTFTFLHHSLDLALNENYDFQGVQLFGRSVITTGCEVDDVCKEAFLDHLLEMTQDWEDNTVTYLAQLQASYDSLEAEDMLYKEDPADFVSLQSWIIARPTEVREAVEYYKSGGGGDTGSWGDTGLGDTDDDD